MTKQKFSAVLLWLSAAYILLLCWLGHLSRVGKTIPLSRNCALRTTAQAQRADSVPPL